MSFCNRWELGSRHGRNQVQFSSKRVWSHIFPICRVSTRINSIFQFLKEKRLHILFIPIIRAVQIGRIPVFVYNDHPWVPYMGSELDISNYGFVGGKTDHENTLPKLIEQLANETDEQVNQKLKVLHDIRWYFTYPGVVYEIEMFLQDPFGVNGGHLRCTTHPRTERCCG